MSAAFVGALVAVAVMLLRPPSASRRLSRPGVLTAVVSAAAVALLLVRFLHGAHVVLALIGLGVAAGVAGLVRRRRAARAAESRRDAVLESCEAMAADLAAGATPRTALERVAGDFPMLLPVASAARVDADVPQALRAIAATPGCQELALVAAAWQVTHRAGAGLAPALATTAASLRDQRSTRRLVASELAGARATGWLMAGLPLLVLLFAAGLGGDPIGFLTGTPVGLGCLGIGLALLLAGWWWLERLAAAVTR